MQRNSERQPLSRRDFLTAGALAAPAAALGATTPSASSDRAVIYIFLSGGLGQHDSFDMKPAAAPEIRGEFKPIATSVPGIAICEHLPKLAQRADRWSLVRSMTHPSNDHSAGHFIMLTGRTTLPIGFDPNRPRSTDWPSLAAVAGTVAPNQGDVPSAIVLPERLVHYSGRVLPGQFAGEMGSNRDPWFVEASAYEPRAYGAFPAYEFDHQQRTYKPARLTFHAPNLALPAGIDGGQLRQRMALLQRFESAPTDWQDSFATRSFASNRQTAGRLLASSRIREAIDVNLAAPQELDRYGRHSFGWSLLMARKLVEVGVRFIQVNLGNNETWDTHGNAFPHLKDRLYPPTDQALSALLDDLAERGMLDTTLVAMAGEFGRTPKVSLLPQHYKRPGRDHWGAAQTVFFAGGGVQGGRVVGATDRIGAFPADNPKTPENLAATLFHSLGLPKSTAWFDHQNRPHYIYHADPISELL